jgi:CheY-like chemotaxis protein
MKKKIKILIAEDEALTAMALCLDLTSLGYETCTPVATGENAIKTVEKDKPDVVLMDIRLSGKMDGIKAAREIYSRFKTPVIFMTGYSNDKIMKKANNIDPASILVKPIQIYEIKAAIKTILK